MKMRTLTSALILSVVIINFAAIAMEKEDKDEKRKSSRVIDFKLIEGVKNTIEMRENGRISVTTDETRNIQLITPSISIERFKKINVSFEVDLQRGAFGIGLLKEDQSAWLTHQIYPTPGVVKGTIKLKGKAPTENSFMALLKRNSIEKNVYLAFTNEAFDKSEFEIRNISFMFTTHPSEPEEKNQESTDNTSSLQTSVSGYLSWIPTFSLTSYIPWNSSSVPSPSDNSEEEGLSADSGWEVVSLED